MPGLVEFPVVHTVETPHGLVQLGVWVVLDEATGLLPRGRSRLGVWSQGPATLPIAWPMSGGELPSTQDYVCAYVTPPIRRREGRTVVHVWGYYWDAATAQAVPFEREILWQKEGTA
jgi:hypothetical protein